MRKLGALLRQFEWKTNGVFPPVITVLVAINVITFLVDVTTGHLAMEWGALNWATFSSGQVWRLFTAGFVHGNFTHLLFNMLFYCFFAHTVHSQLGARRFLWLTVCAILFGNSLQVAYSAFGPENGDPAIMGFSGAFLATIVAFATIAPMARCVFIIVQIPAWLLAAILILLDLAGLFEGRGGTAYLAHLGGAAIGFAFIKFPRLFAWGRWFQRFSDGVTDGIERRRAASRAKDEARLDALLEKVSTDGLPALTEEERTFLTRYSAKKKADD